jgi:hypothetical protein
MLIYLGLRTDDVERAKSSDDALAEDAAARKADSGKADSGKAKTAAKSARRAKPSSA